MNGMSDIEANKACGLDASINVFSVSGEESDTWKVSSTRAVSYTHLDVYKRQGGSRA